MLVLRALGLFQALIETLSVILNYLTRVILVAQTMQLYCEYDDEQYEVNKKNRIITKNELYSRRLIKAWRGAVPDMWLSFNHDQLSFDHPLNQNLRILRPHTCMYA